MTLLIIFLIILVCCGFFLGYGYINSYPLETESADTELANLKDKMYSLETSLRDIDLENKIGKVASEDFNLLKKEILTEWSQKQKELHQYQKNDPPTPADKGEIEANQ